MALGIRSKEVRELILKRVNEICEENHITYCELSNRLNLTSGAVYQWFHLPDRLPSLLSVIDMCEIFGLSLSEFFEEDVIDKQTNIERRMIEGTRKLSTATNERLLSLIEQLVKDSNFKDKMLQKPEQTALKIIRNLVREQRIAELYNGDILAIDELCKVNGKMDMAIWVLAQFADKVKPLAHYPATYPSQLFFLKQNMGYEVVVLLAGEEHLARLLPASTEVKYIFVVESVEMITRIPLPEATCLFATVEHQEHGEPLVHFYSEGKDG